MSVTTSAELRDSWSENTSKQICNVGGCNDYAVLKRMVLFQIDTTSYYAWVNLCPTHSIEMLAREANLNAVVQKPAPVPVPTEEANPI